MKQATLEPSFAILLLFIGTAALLRVPNAAHYTWLANFTPIGAMALFGGAYFKSPLKALLFPLLTLFISDLIICNLVFNGKYGFIYNGWYVVYAIFLLIVLVGRWLLQKVNLVRILGSGMIAAMLHWFIADGGGTDLRTMTPLTKDLSGLIQCYTQGFPFMKNFLLGTIAYCILLFGLFEWIKVTRPHLVLLPLKPNTHE
jgi:hypothetical protein